MSQTGNEKQGRLCVRLAFAVAAAAVVCVFTVFRLGAWFDDAGFDFRDVIPEYTAGEEIGGWVFSGMEAAENEWRLTFGSPGGDAVVTLKPLDTAAASAVKTSFFNVDAAAAGSGADDDARALIGSVVDDLGNKETGARRPGPKVGRRRLVAFQALVFVLLALVLFDAGFMFGGAGRGERKSVGPEKKFKPAAAATAFFIVSGAAVFLINLKNVPWKYFVSVDFYFAPGRIGSAADALGYILSDPGLPTLPYRALMLLMYATRDTMMIRVAAWMFGAGVMCVAYLIARRYVRPWAVWVFPLLMVAPGGAAFNFGLADTRGYMFFSLFGLLSVYFFLAAADRPRPLTLFLFVFCQVAAFTTNPLTITLAAGPAAYYVIALRKRLEACERRLFVAHFGFLAAAFAAFAPFVFRAVGSHRDMFSEATYAHAPLWTVYAFFFLLASIIFAVCAVALRRDERGALFASACAGIWALLIIFGLGVLMSREHYFLFVLPVACVCGGILFESAVKRIERKSVKAGGAAVAVFAVAVAVCLTAFSVSVLQRPGENMKLEKTFEAISEAARDAGGADVHIIVFPFDDFVRYLSWKFEIDPFGNNPAYTAVPGVEMKYENLDSGDVAISVGNLHSSYPEFATPSVLKDKKHISVMTDADSSVESMFLHLILQDPPVCSRICAELESKYNVYVFFCDFTN